MIVTGGFTGQAASLQDLEEVKRSVSRPVLLGSGVNTGNLGEFFDLADGFIVGSDFKRGGDWRKDPDPGRVRAFLKCHRQLAGKRA